MKILEWVKRVNESGLVLHDADQARATATDKQNIAEMMVEVLRNKGLPVAYVPFRLKI